MKRIITLFAIALAMGITTQAVAQMSKDEQKEWKKRLKDTSPEQYKSMVEENKSLKSQVSSLRTEVNNVDGRLKEKDDEIEQYQRQVGNLRDELAKAKAAAPVGGSGSNINENVGVVFKVQIGAFKKVDLSDANSSNFKEEKEGDLNKYTIGVFKDYWEADTFKKRLREMGVREAWVVSYRDGKRVPINEVLGGKI
jgi:DNA repair exonuclease SbcCD ATPase subunit